MTAPNNERSFQTLFELSVPASGVLDTTRLARMVTDHVHLVNGDRVEVWIWDATADALLPLGKCRDDTCDSQLLVPQNCRQSLVTETFFERKATLIRDFAKLGQAGAPAEQAGTATAMAVPLQHGNDAIGVLLASSETPGVFTEDHLDLLSLFAAQLAPALHAAQHHADSEARSADAGGFASLMRLETSASHVEEVLDAVVLTARQLTGSDYSRIVLNEQGYLGPDSAHGAYTTSRLARVLIPGSPIAQCSKSRMTVIVERLGENPEFPPETIPMALREDLRTMLVAPLLTGENLVGYLIVGWRSEVSPTASQVRLAETLAGHSAALVNNAQTQLRAREQERAFRALYEFGVLAGGVLDPAILAQLAVDQVHDLTGADHVGIWLWDASTELLVPLRGYNTTPHAAGFTSRRRGEGLVGEIFSAQEPVLVRDFSPYARAKTPASAGGTVTAIAVPLRHTSAGIGVLIAGSRTPDAFTEEHVRLLSLFAAQLSPALRVAQLHVESDARRVREEQRRLEAEALAELMRLEETATGIKDVVYHIAATAMTLTAADFIRIGVLDGAGGVVQYAHGTISDALPDHRLAADGPFAHCIHDRKTIVVEHIGENTEFPIETMPTVGPEKLRTLMALPLITADRVVGSLTLGWRSDISPGADQVRLGEMLASHAATLIDNAQAHEREREQNRFTTTVMQSLGEGLLVLDTEGCVSFMNPAAEEMLGWSQDELRGQDAHALIHLSCDQDVPRLFGDCPLRHDWSADTIVQVETDTFVRKDGAHLQVSYTASAILNAGQLESLVIAFRDITQQRQARLALETSEARYRQIVETAQEGIFTSNANGHITFANQKMADMVGCTVERLCQSLMFDFMAPEQRATTAANLERGDMMAGKQFDTTLHRPDGKIISISVSVSPLYNEQLEFIGILSMVTNITERKRAEEALAHQARHDSLTGLPNRALLQDRLENAIHAVHRDARPAAVMFLDMDGFKDVNDSFGHKLGDELLRQIGSRLVRALHETDTVARLGGDEFAVVVEGVGGIEEAEAVAAKVLEALETPYIVGEQALSITASIGIATLSTARR